MALIQINVPDDVKARADAAFARNGITTPAAMKMMVTQVANENRTPFDGVFSSPSARELGEDVRRDMLLAEAQEYPTRLCGHHARQAATVCHARRRPLPVGPGRRYDAQPVPRRDSGFAD